MYCTAEVTGAQPLAFGFIFGTRKTLACALLLSHRVAVVQYFRPKPVTAMSCCESYNTHLLF